MVPWGMDMSSSTVKVLLRINSIRPQKNSPLSPKWVYKCGVANVDDLTCPHSITLVIIYIIKDLGFRCNNVNNFEKLSLTYKGFKQQVGTLQRFMRIISVQHYLY